MRTSFCSLITIALLWITNSGEAQPRFKQIPGGFISGNARIQCLTPTLARLEYSPAGSFTDSLTAVVVNRRFPLPDVSTNQEGDWIVLASKQMTIRYRPGPGPLNGSNLEIRWSESGQDRRWTPADSDAQNLGGIGRSLDGARLGRLPKQPPGILSRSGYFILNDSKSPTWNGSAQWIEKRKETGGQDLYFFVYGRNYRHVLKEYADLCGSIPMIPKYTLGSWATDLNYEYLPGSKMVEKYRYTDDSVRSIISRFRTEGIPLDVMVLDFAWHLRGWEGSYDWSPIFPNPSSFFSWAQSQGIKISLNDHPGYGQESVLSFADSRAPAVRTALNIPPSPEPTIAIDLHTGWKFRIDSSRVGEQQEWYAASVDEAKWKDIAIDGPWEDQGYPGYDGVGWYRTWVTIPSDLRAGKLLAVFGSVDDEYDLFVNGKKISHHSPSYGTITSSDISAFVKKGEKNLVALRVNDWGGDGGLYTETAMITDVVRASGLRFNLAERRQADAFMNILHKPLIEQGVSFWWVDGGSGSAEMDGLNSQMWTNHVFYNYTERLTGKRSFIFSRYGGWGNHRYPSLFTGDTYAQWSVLACEVPYTAQGGNVLMPYITHDIGGFIGSNISLELYVRWLQFGVFSPFLRLHSAHENPEEGNVRMPWTYGARGVSLARDLFRLRYRLLPYIYTMTRQAHDEALPIVRPLYLEHPELEKAYGQPYEYYFGDAMLVAPLVDSGGVRDVYLPPGEWVDYFSGTRHPGDRTMRVTCPLETMPLYVRSGSIIPQQPDMDYIDQRPLDTLIVNVYGPEKGEFTLYEDDGSSVEYRAGKSASTRMSFADQSSGTYQLAIEPTQGTFAGQPDHRAYTIRLTGLTKPTMVKIDGKTVAPGVAASTTWRWEERAGSIIIQTDPKSIRERVAIDILTAKN